MSEITENTITQYLGPEFQKHLMWQILVEPEFADKVMPDLAVEYFDDPNLKRLFIIIHDYIKMYEKIPNLYNDSIQLAIHKFKTPNNIIEEESLIQTVERIKLYNDGILNGSYPSNATEIQKETTGFIKQQEYRKLGEFIIGGVRSGEIRKKTFLGTIEEKTTKISHIGDTEDQGTSVIEGVDKALRKEFRETTPSGVVVIDELTGGGLGKGEIGFILTPSGVGKTTLLTKIANTGYDCGENVLQIIFEDTEDQIKRKHYTIWSKIPLSETDDRRDEVNDRVQEKIKSIKGGRLIIKKFSQENTSMITIRNWMSTYEKKHGFKFGLLVLDYLDCLESHKKVADRNEAELVIVKSFLALAADFNIPAWSALQGNRGSFDAKFLDVKEMGGNIKRIQKSHFFMSVAKPENMKDTKLANVKIIKARFAKDGQLFKDSTFDNDYLDIRLNDQDYGNIYSKKLPKKSIKTTDTTFGISTETQHNSMLSKYAEQSKSIEIVKETKPSIYSAVGTVPVVLTTDDIPEVIPSVDEIVQLFNKVAVEEEILLPEPPLFVPLVPIVQIGYGNGEYINTTTTTIDPILEVDEGLPIIGHYNVDAVFNDSEPTTIDGNSEISLPAEIKPLIIFKKTKGRPPLINKEDVIRKVIELRSQGYSYVKISDILKISKSLSRNIMISLEEKENKTPELVVINTVEEPIVVEPDTIPIVEETIVVEPEIIKPIPEEQPMDREEMRKFEETFDDPDI